MGNSPGGSEARRRMCTWATGTRSRPLCRHGVAHILEQHPHTLDLSPSEEEQHPGGMEARAALVQDFGAEQPSHTTQVVGAGVKGGGRVRTYS